MKGGIGKVAWAALAVLGAFCLGTIALRRGESINALWIVVAAVSIYLVAYRFYARFIADRVFNLDATRASLMRKIVRDLTGMDIKLGQIDIKFTRRNYADIQTKAQVLTTMLGNDKIHPELAFTYCGMFPDPSEAYLKSEQYAKDQQEKMLDEMDRLQTQQPQDARVEADAAQEVTDV